MKNPLSPRCPRLVFLVVFLSSLIVCCQTVWAQGSGLAGLRGDSLTEQSLGSGSHVLIFWASWSPKCRDIDQRSARISSGWSSKARVVMVNFQEDRETVESFLSGSGSIATYLDADGSFAKRHAVLNLPGLLVVKDGKVLYQGRLPADVDQLLGSLLN
jgi:thiol-disulfide isomerase/thioredoxin